MKTLLNFLFCLLMPYLAIAQKEHKDIQPKFGKAHCNSYEGYIPYNSKYMPIKRVRLALHIFQRDDGSGNLQDVRADKEFIDRILNHCNAVYAHPDTMKPYLPGKQFNFSDSRIRFVIDTIFFHRDSKEYNFKAHAGRYDNDKKDTFQDNGLAFEEAEKLYKKHIEQNNLIPARDKDSAISVLFIEGGNWAGRGMTYSLFSKRWIYIPGSWYSYKFANGAPNHWSNGLVMAHELGHALGMNHPYNSHECKDLPNTEMGKTNNFMDGWPGEAAAMTPCQIGTMHFGLSGHEGDIGNAVIRDWCFYHSNEEMHILPGDTVYFDGDRNLLGDLIIEAGAVLIVKCRLSMPPTGTITIKPKGCFIIDGGEVYNACGLQWNGIIMAKRKSFLFFKRKSLSVFQVFNDGYFHNSENGIMKTYFKKE